MRVAYQESESMRVIAVSVVINSIVMSSLRRSAKVRAQLGYLRRCSLGKSIRVTTYEDFVDLRVEVLRVIC